MPQKFTSTLDDSQFAAGLRRMEKGSNKVAGEITKAFSNIGGLTAGGVGFAAMAFSANALVNKMSELADVAASVNVPVEDFQRAAFVFGQTGARTEEARKGVFNLSNALLEARDPSSKAAKALEMLNLDLQNLDASDPVNAMASIADATNSSSDKSAAFAAVADLVGSKLAVKLIPALAMGGDEFRRLAASANVASEATVEFFDNLGDQRDKAFSDFANATGNALYTTGALASDAFKQGFEGEGGGILGTLGGALNAARAMMTGIVDPDEAMRMAGRDPAVDSDVVAKEDARIKAAAMRKVAVNKEVEERRMSEVEKAQEEEYQFTAKLRELTYQDEQKAMTEASEAAKKLDAERANRLYQDELDQVKAADELAKKEQERLVQLEAMTAELRAQVKEKNIQSHIDDIEAGPDARRQNNRDAGDDRRTRKRAEKQVDYEEKQAKFRAEHGIRREGQKYRDAEAAGVTAKEEKNVSTISEASIDKLVKQIADLQEALITK